MKPSPTRQRGSGQSREWFGSMVSRNRLGKGRGRGCGLANWDAHADSLGVTRCDSEKSVGNRREETYEETNKQSKQNYRIYSTIEEIFQSLKFDFSISPIHIFEPPPGGNKRFLMVLTHPITVDSPPKSPARPIQGVSVSRWTRAYRITSYHATPSSQPRTRLSRHPIPAPSVIVLAFQ
jgi:hypothetical protein